MVEYGGGMALRRARCGKPPEGGSKNQLTLPKAVVDRFPGVGYFAVREEGGRIVLSPVVPEPGPSAHGPFTGLGGILSPTPPPATGFSSDGGTMLREYLSAAMDRASFESLPEEDAMYGEIPGFDGVFAHAPTTEVCRHELEEVLEEWVLFRVSRNLSLP
ncbi:MAG TPA: AbrB/MazE/SpoVT family DNA-binding domain-containing protein, partial [Longimicrobiales bacterium]|nr:AbrB/MazE/SpoVT family DNA-binding domain-containing protein [Longimicrobiales bacterium]